MAYIGGLIKSLTAQHADKTLKKVLFLTIILVCLSAQASADLNLARENPSPTQIAGQTFPRNDKILYRGTHAAQYSYVKAVKAMLDDQMALLESPMLAALKELLMGKETSHLFSKINGLESEYTELGFHRLVETKLRINSGSLNEKQANKAATEILSTVYDAELARSRVYDYVSPKRNDFPTSFIYSTVYIEVAKVYSAQIVLIKENNPRSLDANYWNKIHNGKWVHTNLTYPDRGEFIAPFYIPAQDIIGYQVNRYNYTNTVWNIWSPLIADLDVVFMKKNLGSKSSYVYVFDAKYLEHVVEVNGQFCSAKTVFNQYAEIPQYAIPDCAKKPKLIAVLKACSTLEINSKSCSVPSAFFDPYQMSTNNYSESIDVFKQQSLSNGEKVIIFTAPGTYMQKMNDTRQTDKNKRSPQ